MDPSTITPIRDVIDGNHPGRGSADEITLFDRTDVGLQDLAVASGAATIAKDRRKVIEVKL